MRQVSMGVLNKYFGMPLKMEKSTKTGILFENLYQGDLMWPVPMLFHDKLIR